MERKQPSFRKDDRGAIAMVLGLAMPVLLIGVAAGMEYGQLAARRTQLQRAADSAALAAARELTLANADDARVGSVARNAALTALSSGKPEGTTATAQGVVIDKRSGVQVTVTETVSSLMGKVLSLPASELSAKATAKLSGGGRLCVLALDVKSTYAINLDQNARMTANGCSVQSNSKDQKSISARQYSLLTAERICSSGGYEGRTGSNVTPQPLTDCPQIPDPLAKRTPPQVGICDYGSLNPPTPYAVSAKTRTLSPGTYCGGLTITDGSNVTLGQGTYVIKDGPLIVEKGSTLAGEYVGFYLTGNAATFRFDFDTTVSLSAPKTGAMAGLLFFGDPNNNTGSAYRILSDNARKLLGTIYLPAGQLLVDANKPIADQSAYTVIVARTIQLNSGPNLVLNANYGSTDVPVPQGVGPLDNKIALSQ